ncbi:MAG: HD domain-containing protein [Desulfocapsaceae bacterium]|jgi:poly(A) polymerase|nr:HD domain-containing protein [Desulfocapsaceae bacterium]
MVSVDTIFERLADYPGDLLQTLLETAESRSVSLYISGGALRDWLLGTSPKDLDFTISYDAEEFLREAKSRYGSGTIVPLGTRHDDTCRLVLDGLSVDVSGFRGGSATIREDLSRRDFTVNALSADFQEIFTGGQEIEIIDPMNGIEDLQRKLIRACPGAFSDDPLRLLRAFRFAALLGFEIVPETLASISAKANLIGLSAAERIRYELEQIMLSPRAYPAFAAMHAAGLVEWIAPELSEGDGVSQPAFHHLDVLQHNLFALDCIERIISAPEEFFPENRRAVSSYLADNGRRAAVKWAALFHDVGKPESRDILTDKDDRITFYGHDEKGALRFKEFAERLRWSRADRERVVRLIAMHMHPFHLGNTLREEGHLSQRAQMKICRKAGDDLAGLFLVAMADSMAGQGEDKVDSIEEELACLFDRLETLNREKLLPVLSGPKLLTGHDLADTLGIPPGPVFREILETLDMAIIEGTVNDREGALEWVRGFLMERDEHSGER